ERLFEPFTQGESSTSRKYGGTGLGLVISRRFAQMMGGDISVVSNAGHGSSFTLILPRSAPTEGSLETETVLATTSGKAARSTVLVIDDDPSVHEVLVRSLAKHDLNVESAFDGQEGLRLARTLHPYAITLDVTLPGIDGWTVLAALKSDPQLADIPVVMLTMVDNRNLGYALGAADYLIKPIDRERLAAALMRFGGASPRTALVVEDDPDSREVLRRLLEQDGWIVDEAENGRAALAHLDKTPPSVILLDLMMPEMDGFEFIEELRARAHFRKVPIIVVTARELSQDERQRLSGHVEKVLQKTSYTREELLQQVNELLTIHRSIPKAG
ncbi:MAG: response regulator, partial [Bryobacteraceae bacterium]|nr:response regulator [Bryobacteraceae bacterium]